MTIEQPRKIAFSQSSIQKLVPPATGRVQWWDSSTPNLCCRISHTGARAFYWIGRQAGQWKREKLGLWPEMNANGAKSEAKRLNGQVALGQKIKTRKAELTDEWTLRQLFDWYLENISKPHKRSWKSDERQFENRFMPWENRPVSSIEKDEVRQYHNDLKDERGKYAANKMLELLGTMYRSGAENHPLRVPCGDPTAGIKRFQRDERERFLDADELPRFLAEVAKMPRETSRDAVLMMLWTGARRSNVETMRIDEISLKTGVWRIPAEKSKNKRPMNIVLTAQALSILKRRIKVVQGGPWIFPGQGRTGHIVDVRDSFKTAVKNAGLKDVRFHDMRRTLGSWMAIDTPLQTIGKQLGHKSVKSTAIYARLADNVLKKAVGNTTAAMAKAIRKKV